MTCQLVNVRAEMRNGLCFDAVAECSCGWTFWGSGWNPTYASDDVTDPTIVENIMWVDVADERAAALAVRNLHAAFDRAHAIPA